MKRLFLIPFIFIGCLLVVFLFVIPQFQEYQELEKSLVLAQEVLSKNDIFLNQLKKIASELSKKEESLQRIESALPDDFSLPDLFYYLQNEIEANGLLLKGIGLQEQLFNQKTKVDTDSSELAVLNPRLAIFKTHFVSINAIGSLAALESFFKSIEKSSRLIFLESFRSGLSSEEMPSFSLVLKLYSK